MFDAEPGVASHHRARQCLKISAAVLLLLLSPAVYAAGLKTTLKKEPVSIRLIGRASPLPTTSFGANYDSYVAELHTAKNDARLVKLVYRFLSYDPSFPKALVDYDILHRFRAVRQPDCDETADTMLYSHRVAASGEIVESDFSFEYAKHASDVAIPPATVLPCYVVTPADYKGSKQVSAAPSHAVVNNKDAGTQRAAKSPLP